MHRPLVTLPIIALLFFLSGCSGMGGFGGYAMKRRRLGRLIVVGDMKTDVAARPPLAPRVMQCAAMQADAALEWLLTGNIKDLL